MKCVIYVPMSYENIFLDSQISPFTTNDTEYYALDRKVHLQILVGFIINYSIYGQQTMIDQLETFKLI